MSQSLIKISLLGLFACICLTLSAQPKTYSLKEQRGFIENKGQIVDQNRQANSSVKYLYLGNGFNIQLKANGYSYDLFKFSDSATKKESELAQQHERINQPSTLHFQRFDIEFVGANANPQILASLPGSDYLNYYTGDNSKGGYSHIQHFGKIVYKDLYPGIDLEFTADPNQGPKYNFIIYPGANASTIKWRYKGDNIPSIKENQLRFATVFGELKEEIPHSFLLNSKHEIETGIKVSYKQEGPKLFGFDVPKLNRKQTLIIDPRPWITYYGGEAVDHAIAVDTDNQDNVYVSGNTRSIGNIATIGSYQDSLYASLDFYLVKFDPSGQRQWATYLGGDSEEYSYGLVTTVNGTSYLCGDTYSSFGLASINAHQSSLSGNFDGFVAQFDSSGQLGWASYYGGQNMDIVNQVCLDSNDNLYLVGRTTSLDNISTPGAFQTSHADSTVNFDGFIAKFTSSGTRIWGTYFGGTGSDAPKTIHYNPVDYHIYIGGQTSGTDGIATSGAYMTSKYLYGYYDAFLLKFNLNGSRIWGTYFGGNANEDGRGVTSDDHGNVYLTGYTQSVINIATPNAIRTSIIGTNDLYIAKFTPNATLCWSTYYGGNQIEDSRYIAYQNNGNIITIGSTGSSTMLATNNAYNDTFNGANDAYILSIDTSCTLNWATYLGGEREDFPFGLAINSKREIIVCGYTRSTFGLSTSNAHQTSLNNTYDGFVAQFSEDGFMNTIENNEIHSKRICGVQGDTLFGESSTSYFGSLQYRWVVSTTDSMSGFQAVSNADTNLNLIPTTSNTVQYFRRIVQIGNLIDTSNALEFYPFPIADIASATDTLCKGEELTLFSNTSYFRSDSLRFTWNLNASSQSVIDSFHYQYDSSGSFVVQLKVVSEKGCADSISTQIRVRENPKAVIQASHDSICAQSTLNLSEINLGSLDSISLYSWDLGDQSTFNLSNSLSHVYDSSGTFQISLRVLSHFGCADTAYGQVTVMPKPEAQIWTDFDSVCYATPILFVDSSHILSQVALNRQWDFADNATDTSFSITKPMFQLGSFGVQLLVSSPFGCADTASISSFVHPLPQVGTIQSPVADPQLNLSYLYSVNLESGTTYLWEAGNAQIQNGQGTEKVNVIWTSKGPVTLKLRLETAFACLDSLEAHYDVTDVPEILSFNPTTGYRGDTITILGRNFYGTHTVMFGGVPADSFHYISDSVVLAYPGIGNKGAIEVSNPQGTASKTWFEFTWQLDVEHLEQSLVVYPNPAESEVYINAQDLQISRLELVSMDGKSMAADYSIQDGRVKVNLKGLKPGVYVLKMEDKTGIRIAKLSIKG